MLDLHSNLGSKQDHAAQHELLYKMALDNEDIHQTCTYLRCTSKFSVALKLFLFPAEANLWRTSARYLQDQIFAF